jgi:hypothetical protein
LAQGEKATTLAHFVKATATAALLASPDAASLRALSQRHRWVSYG